MLLLNSRIVVRRTISVLRIKLERGESLNNVRRKRAPLYTEKLFPILILVAVMFMGVGYASINSIAMNINGEVVVKKQENIYY